MRTENFERHQRVIIGPGEQYVSNVPVTITTLLGSCVAVCLYDPVNHVMGMNHFLLSSNQVVNHGPIFLTEAGRYGIHAMELLINEMLKLGARRTCLKAKAFGGGNVLKDLRSIQNNMSVGDANVEFVREFLECEQIPLVAESLGGEDGRVIHFSFGSFKVYARKIKNVNQERLIAQRDRDCWIHAIREQEDYLSKPDRIELWNTQRHLSR